MDVQRLPSGYLTYLPVSLTSCVVKTMEGIVHTAGVQINAKSGDSASQRQGLPAVGVDFIEVGSRRWP